MLGFKFVPTFLSALFLILFVGCASKSKDIKSKQAGLYFGAGTQSLLEQQYTEALTNLIKANELEPGNSEILNNLGMAYYFKDERDMAIKHLNLALEANENNSDAKVNLASIYYKEGNTQEAERLYKTVLKDLTYDKQARTFYNLGLLELQKKKDPKAAENYFQKSVKEDDNYCPSHLQLGILNYDKKNYTMALKNFKDASMGVCYDSPAPHYYQGMALMGLKRFNEARIKFDEIDTRFKKTVYAVKARTKAMEITELESRYKSEETHASRKTLESPDF